jgi:hypothetical protein
MKLLQTSTRLITLGATVMSIGAIAIGVSAAVPARSAQPAATPTSIVQSNESQPMVCANTIDMFAQDESSLLASEYSQVGTADCMFVGCGGVF